MSARSCVMKAIASSYRVDSDMAFERHRSRIPINCDELETVQSLKKHLFTTLEPSERSYKMRGQLFYPPQVVLSHAKDHHGFWKYKIHATASVNRDLNWNGECNEGIGIEVPSSETTKTVRGENTKDKAGALPPAVYTYSRRRSRTTQQTRMLKMN